MRKFAPNAVSLERVAFYTNFLNLGQNNLFTSDPNPSDILAAEVAGVNLLNSVKLRLAAQYAPRRWQAWLFAVAQAVESGRSLEQAVDTCRAAPHEQLRQLVSSAMRVKDPMQLVLEALQARDRLRATWREFHVSY